jgi:DNA topoisomerase-1
VNDYIKNMVQEDFTAKVFRTWGGTKLAAEFLPEAKKMLKKNNRLQLEPTLVKLVAQTLGNTVATCRKYYIHPDILHDLTVDKTTNPINESGTDYLDPSEVYILKVIS